MSQPFESSVLDDPARLLEAALAMTPDGVALVRAARDREGSIASFRVVRINPAGAAPFADDPAQVVGCDVEELLGPGNAAVVSAFGRALDTGRQQRFRATFTHTPAAGTIDAIVVRLDAEHLMTAWRDVTDQIVQEGILQEALRQANDSLSRMRAALDAMDDAVLLIEISAAKEITAPEVAQRAHLTYANAIAALALGLPTAQLVGMRLDSVVPPSAAHALGALIAECVTDGRPCTRRFTMRGPTGELQDAREITATPLPDSRVLLVSRDTTRQEWNRL